MARSFCCSPDGHRVYVVGSVRAFAMLQPVDLASTVLFPASLERRENVRARRLLLLHVRPCSRVHHPWPDAAS